MATVATIAAPYPLRIECLLASSWTWFAILFATIATALRALRVFLLRQRLSSPIASLPPSAILFSEAATPLLSTSASSLPFAPLSKSFKRRPRSKSTSALEKLHENGEGFLRSGVELLSSVLDADFAPAIRKIRSASKLFHDQMLCQKPRQGGDARDRKAGVYSADAFISGSRVQESKACSCEEKLHHKDEDVPSWLPSWAHSLCDPLQMAFSFPSSSHDGGHNDSAPPQKLPCFEKQFGWDRLLQMKLGSSWSSPAQCVSAEDSPYVVKMWAGRQKQLLKTLDSDGLALDLCVQDCLACTGNGAGLISLWELGCKAYVKASVSIAQPVVSLSMNPEQGVTMVGSGGGIYLWDQRTPHCMPLKFRSAIPTGNTSLFSLESRGFGFCAAHRDNTLSMYDLRKLQGESLCAGPASKKQPTSSDADDEAESHLLEKFTCEVDEDFWDEGSVSSVGNEVDGSSLVSRFASYMRAAVF